MRHRLLETFLNIGGAAVALADARRSRAAAMLCGETPPDQDEERRAWSDPRGAV